MVHTATLAIPGVVALCVADGAVEDFGQREPLWRADGKRGQVSSNHLSEQLTKDCRDRVADLLKPMSGTTPQVPVARESLQKLDFLKCKAPEPTFPADPVRESAMIAAALMLRKLSVRITARS